MVGKRPEGRRVLKLVWGLALVLVVAVIAVTVLIKSTSVGDLFSGTGCQPSPKGIYCSNYTIVENGNLSLMLFQATGHTLQNVGVSCVAVNTANISSLLGAPGKLNYTYLTGLSWMNGTKLYVQDLPCYGSDGKTVLSGLTVGEQLNSFVYFNYTYGEGNSSSYTYGGSNSFSTSLSFVTKVVSGSDYANVLRNS